MVRDRQEDVSDSFGDTGSLPLPSLSLTDNQYAFCNIPLDMQPLKGPLSSTNPTLIQYPAAKPGQDPGGEGT